MAWWDLPLRYASNADRGSILQPTRQMRPHEARRGIRATKFVIPVLERPIGRFEKLFRQSAAANACFFPCADEIFELLVCQELGVLGGSPSVSAGRMNRVG